VKNALLSHDHVVLLSYSQGTIISSYIVRKILKDPELRPHAHKLEIYCLAGVADSLHIDYTLTAEHGHPVPYVEHFANGQDFFARIGVLSHYYSTSGAVFVCPERKGHMLTDHYIAGIRRGDYCQGARGSASMWPATNLASRITWPSTAGAECPRTASPPVDEKTAPRRGFSCLPPAVVQVVTFFVPLCWRFTGLSSWLTSFAGSG